MSRRKFDGLHRTFDPPVDRGLTTHWYYVKEIQRRDPKIAANEDRIFIDRRTNMDIRRHEGGQSQFSTLLDLDAESDRIQTALAYAKEHLSAPLPVQSQRQFSRLFKEETGQSPGKAIERPRVESARLMTEAGRFSAEEIARKNGYRERMRRSFVREFGRPPQTIQRTVNALVQ